MAIKNKNKTYRFSFYESGYVPDYENREIRYWSDGCTLVPVFYEKGYMNREEVDKLLEIDEKKTD